MDILTAIFGVQGQVSIGQECARAAPIFCYGLLLLRVSGRRTFGKWSALDVIVSIISGSTLSRALTGNAPFAGTLAAIAVLVGIHWALARLAARIRSVSRLVEGSPVILAEAGQLDERARRQYSVSEVDIAEALHRKGLREVAETSRIVLDANGQLNASA